jgi:hypothetical protein
MRRFIESESLHRIHRLSKASDASRVLNQYFQHVQENPMNVFLEVGPSRRPEPLRDLTSDYLIHLHTNRHDPRLQWIHDTHVREEGGPLTGMRSQEALSSQLYSAWLDRGRQNILQRLTDFDTRLGKMFDDYTYLSTAVKPDSMFLLHQAELSRTATSLQLNAKVNAMRLSYTTSTQSLEVRHHTFGYQSDFLYAMLTMPTGHDDLAHERRESTETFMKRYIDLTTNIEHLERLWYTHRAGNLRPHQIYYSQEGDCLGITRTLDVTDQAWDTFYSDILPVEPFREVDEPYPQRFPYQFTDRNPFGGTVSPDGQSFFQGERLASWRRSALRLLP